MGSIAIGRGSALACVHFEELRATTDAVYKQTPSILAHLSFIIYRLRVHPLLTLMADMT